MNEKTFIALINPALEAVNKKLEKLTASNTFTKSQLEAVHQLQAEHDDLIAVQNQWVVRNSNNYNIKFVDASEVNRHQTVVFISNDFARDCKLFIKRLTNEGQTAHIFNHARGDVDTQKVYAHKNNRTSYVCDGHTTRRLQFIRTVADEQAVTIDDIMLHSSDDSFYNMEVARVIAVNNTLLKQWCHQLYEYRPDLKLVRSAKVLVDICNSIVRESGYDVDASALGYTDKMSVFTCTDDSNEYLNRGESSVHCEQRMKLTQVYDTILTAVMNATQVLAYQAYDITEELDVRAQQDADALAYFQDIDDTCGTTHAQQYALEHPDRVVDINPEWLA